MSLNSLRRRLHGWQHHPEVVAVTIVLVAVPMLAGWVPPNPYYGFRTPSTTASLQEWYSSNRLMGGYMIASQVLALGTMHAVTCALVAWCGRDRLTWGVLWSCLLALFGIGAAVVHYYSSA